MNEVREVLARVASAIPVKLLAPYHPMPVVNEYIKFLTLKVLHDDVLTVPPEIVPSGAVNDVWHTHRDKTNSYLRSCQLMMPNRNPSEAVFVYTDELCPRDEDRYRQTLKLYHFYFWKQPDITIWPIKVTFTEHKQAIPGMSNYQSSKLLRLSASTPKILNLPMSAKGFSLKPQTLRYGKRWRKKMREQHIVEIDLTKDDDVLFEITKGFTDTLD